MPLTRPPLSFLNSNSTVFNDPLLVLHQGSGSADSDVGFVFNRANGLVANVAVYWSETDDTFYTAYTNSGGATDANLVPTSYAPFTVGTINANNAVVTGNLTVSGTTTTINTTNSTISDSLIELNSGAGSNANDLGFIFERGSTGDNAAIIWDESADTFVLGTTTATGASTGDLTITNGDLQVDTIKNREQRYTTSNMMKFNQVYTGAAAGSYFTQNEYQKIVTIVPSDDSQNYQVSGRILCQTASSVQTINFIAGLRSNTLPDLDWSITYTEQHNGTAHFKPQLWVKETTTAGFIFAIQKISSGNLYGTVTVDLDVIPRSNSQLDNVTVNTTQDSEQTSIDAGYTANDMTLVQSISGSAIEFSNAYTFPTSDGSANQILTTNGSGTLSFADASGGGDVVGDTTPQLGGDLDVNGQKITSASNGHIEITPNGTGKVGIGTSSPGYTLDVATASGDAEMRLRTAGTNTGDHSIFRNSIGGTTGSNYIFFGDSADSDAGFIRYNHSDNAMYFQTNASEAMRIDSSGKVGIGATSPTTSLEINAANTLGATFTGTTAGEGVEVSQTSYTADNYVSLIEGKHLASQAAPHVRIGAQYTGSGSKLVFGTSNSYASGITNSALTIDPSGNATFSANVTASYLIGTATSALYAVLAEKYVADKDYEPGSIMVIGGDKEVTASSSYMDPAVAGVVSTNPAFLMNKDLTAEHVVDLALTGRVPCKVHGIINRGDMIVSGNIAGVGTSCTDPKFGTVVGKALENYNSKEVGIIEVIAGRL